MNPSTVYYPATNNNTNNSNNNNFKRSDSADDILSSFLIDSDDNKTKLDNFLLLTFDDDDDEDCCEPLDAFPTTSHAAVIDVEQQLPDAIRSSTNDDEPPILTPTIDFGYLKPRKRFPRRVSEESTLTSTTSSTATSMEIMSTTAVDSSSFSSSSSYSFSYDEQEQEQEEEVVVVQKVIVLGPYDVLCGREAQAWNNEGNVRFRSIISDNVQRYMNASTTSAKTAVIKSVIHQVVQGGTDGHGRHGRFIKQGSDGSYLRELTKRETHQKVGHAIRDLVKQLQQRRDGDGGEEEEEADNVLLEYTNQPQRVVSLVSSSSSSSCTTKSSTTTAPTVPVMMVEEDDIWGMKFYHLEK